MKFLSAILLALSLHTTAVFAQESKETPPVPTPSLDCEEAITVFHDVSRLGRKDRAAKVMTNKHADMAREGWHFADMEVYIENGDLEGFYLSYTRAVACQDEAGNNN